MSFLINALTAVFGKPKIYNDGGITMFSPEETDEEYHWREKEKCGACDKHRVAMAIPQYEDFGHSFTQYMCANCAKEMYGISRYLFNVYTAKEELPW